MSRVRILYSRLRVEEKLLLSAAKRLNVPHSFEDVRSRIWPEVVGEKGDVVICRCVSQNQNIALAQLLESRGIRVINPSRVMQICGDKVTTAAILDAAGIPQPDYRVAFSPEGAVAAAEDLGYPVVFKPAVGSWGRLLAKVNDREAAEAIVEHKAQLGSQHQVFFIQNYVEKGGYDLRATIIGGEPISAIKRWSEHWITNTARGGRPEGHPLDADLVNLLKGVHGALGGDFLAVDLFMTEKGWVVNEVNGQPEFRSSIDTTGVDVPSLMVQYAWSLTNSQ